jgi:hypothetical protein
MNDFWDKWGSSNGHLNANPEVPSAIDRILQAKNMEGPEQSIMIGLTDRGRFAAGLGLPVEAGTRVSFRYNTGSVLTYDDIPAEGVEGVVVKVKSAEGKVTASEDGLVFVKWDDGAFRPVLASHLEPAKGSKRMANSVVLRTAELSSLAGFFTQAASVNTEDELVHMATKDLWSFRQDSGGFVIERLFDTAGDPLKEK